MLFGAQAPGSVVLTDQSCVALRSESGTADSLMAAGKMVPDPGEMESVFLDKAGMRVFLFLSSPVDY